MFGNRFSIPASAIAVAGACSVLFSSQAAVGQRYQQTSFPQYARAQQSNLSARATQSPPPIGGGDSTSMSPDSWGESAINRPNVSFSQPNISYGNYSSPSPAPSRYPLQQQFTTPATGVTQSVQNPQAISPPERLAMNTPINSPQGASESGGSALTNTQYSRIAAQTNPHINAAFSRDRVKELSQTPELPKVDFSLTGEKEAGSFEQLLLDASSKTDTSQITGDTPLSNTESHSILNNNATSPVSTGPSDLSAPSTALQSAEPTVNQFIQPTTPRSVPPTIQQQPQFTAAPIQQQPQFTAAPIQQQPQFTAAPIQPTYFQPTSQHVQQSSGQLDIGYPLSGQVYSQSYIDTPANTPGNGFGFGRPTYNPNVGKRMPEPTDRNSLIVDTGESFDFETKKKQFPPFSEIIASGRFFYSAELALLRPHFLGNTAISTEGPTFSESTPFEFDNETAPIIRFGFESKYGPGAEITYFTLNANSNPISETFGGTDPITTIASITGPNRFSELSADALGETLVVNHSFEIETISANVFKELQFKVSRINGQFGFTYANIAQSLEASVEDAAGTELDSLNSTSDFRGFGPKFGIEYYRPVGHTPLEFITSFGGSGLFGRRDQFVGNTAGQVERRFGADEFITVIDFKSGLQFKKTIGENRSWFARVSFVHQSWLGGGTAVDPQGDFGLKGFTFGVGYNR